MTVTGAGRLVAYVASIAWSASRTKCTVVFIDFLLKTKMSCKVFMGHSFGKFQNEYQVAI